MEMKKPGIYHRDSKRRGSTEPSGKGSWTATRLRRARPVVDAARKFKGGLVDQYTLSARTLLALGVEFRDHGYLDIRAPLSLSIQTEKKINGPVLVASKNLRESLYIPRP